MSFGPAEIDRTSLRQTAEQLEAVVDAFPVRGSLHDSPERPIVSATCQSWDDDEGWGVLISRQVPGELFAHFSHIDGDGYRELRPGERVLIEWEHLPSGQQDGYHYRATRVRRENPA